MGYNVCGKINQDKNKRREIMKKKNSTGGLTVACVFYLLAVLTVLRFDQMGEMKAGVFLAVVEVILGTFFWVAAKEEEKKNLPQATKRSPSSRGQVQRKR